MQFLPLFINPPSQEQENDPRELLQKCSHPSVFNSHSSMSLQAEAEVLFVPLVMYPLAHFLQPVEASESE